MSESVSALSMETGLFVPIFFASKDFHYYRCRNASTKEALVLIEFFVSPNNY